MTIAPRRAEVSFPECTSLTLTVRPQLLANPGLGVLADVAKDPNRWAIEPKVDGIRRLVAYSPDETIETRNRHGERRDWLRDGA